jgi:hypothetical protein
MPTYNEYGEPVETEEERRRRLEREAAYGAAQDAEDASMGASMTAQSENTPRGGFMDAVGNYAQRRFDQAVQPFTDPTAALNRRMGMTPEEAANTEVQSTQVKTYGDGSQEEIVKRQIPASAEPTAAAPVNPAEMGAVPQATAQPAQKSPEEIARNAQALRAMVTQQRAGGAPAPQPEAAPAPAAVPQQLPAQGPIAPEAAAQVPEIGQVPTPGPGVQLAGPMVPGAVPPTTPTGAPQVAAPTPAPSLAQAGAQAAATPAPVAQPPAEPAWLQAANAAGTDFGKLVDVAAKFPESRSAIQAKLQGVVEESRKAQEAQKIVEAAQSGDPKAINKLEQSLRPSRGKEKEEVTVGDYLKAYMYARLGLNDLAADVQAKITGKDTEFGQVQLGGTNWRVEKNRKTGEIVRAQDDEGTPATQSTINKLSAAGQKYGTQAFGFTGEPGIVREADGTTAEVRQRTNSITGKIENIYVTGPKAGEKYTGTQVPQAKSVSTAAAKTDYNLAADLYKKHSGNVIDMLKEYEILKGPLSDEGRGQFLRQYGYGGTIPGPGQNNKTTETPVDSAAVARAQGDIASLDREIKSTKPSETKRLQILQQERNQAQQRLQQASGGVTTGGRVDGGVSTTSISGLKTGQEIGKAGALENIQVQGARAQSFNKILDEEVRPQAQAGDTVSSVRKQQFAIFDRPGVDANKLFGLYNAAAEGTGDQKLSIIRDIFGGIFKPEAEVSQRLAGLNLTPQEKSALMEYNTANQKVNAATLKQNSGPGAISDAEQRANREANVDITKVPALGAFNAMAQSQFDGDRARWKADWATKQPAQNALELDKAWRKENQRLADMYRETATQRARFIAENGGTTAAVQQGYKRFPVPEYDPATESWKKTRPLSSYNR